MRDGREVKEKIITEGKRAALPLRFVLSAFLCVENKAITLLGSGGAFCVFRLMSVYGMLKRGFFSASSVLTAAKRPIRSLKTAAGWFICGVKKIGL